MAGGKGMVKAVALIAGDNNVRGSLQFVQDSSGATHVKGKISGLSEGRHGFHIHALGDTTNGCNSTGPHFNPFKKNHGAPTDHERHAGDLGNIVAGQDGVAEISILDMQVPLSGPHSILGRAVVVHADPDDLGRGGHELSKTTGNAGARVGCGHPSLINKSAFRHPGMFAHLADNPFSLTSHHQGNQWFAPCLGCASIMESLLLLQSSGEEIEKEELERKHRLRIFLSFPTKILGHPSSSLMRKPDL